jgi:alcohol dehydrogenase
MAGGYLALKSPPHDYKKEQERPVAAPALFLPIFTRLAAGSKMNYNETSARHHSCPDCLSKIDKPHHHPLSRGLFMVAPHTELRKFVIPEFVFGPGARQLAGRYARNFGASEVLVVTDPGIIAAGWTGEVTASLEAAGLSCHLFAGLTPNPKGEEVMAGAEMYARKRCDTIVAVGGGSPIDCAKGIGIVSTNGGHILDYEGVDRIACPGPPLICIPTTAGSSADVSQFAIVTDTGRRVKITIISKLVVPDVSLIDPMTLTTMSSDLTAYTGMDALTHAFEAYASNAASPITDLFALEAIRLLAAHLRAASKKPDDLDLRALTMRGCLYAGLAFSNASLGLLHAMTHSLGGYLDMQHGASNAILLKSVVAYNFHSAPARYAAIGEALGLDLRGRDASAQKNLLLEAISHLQEELQVGKPLTRLGVRRSDLAALAATALNDPSVATNPRRPTRSEIEELYERTL